MDTRKRGTTTDMQVTSIRLEPELKERLRELSGEQGYQSLIRDVLWQFVEQQVTPLQKPAAMLTPGRSHFEVERHFLRRTARSPLLPLVLSRSEIRVIFRAIAQREECCAVTGQRIQPQESMWLALTMTGEFVPVSAETILDEQIP